MGLETGTYIDSLNASNPVGATDPKSQGDDHIRLIKSTIKATFPNLDAAMTATEDDLNILAGAIAANRVTIPVGDSLRVQDAAGTDFIDISHDGTDANIALTNAADLNITGGALVKIWDASGADNIALSHDGTDAGIEGTGADSFHFTGMAGALSLRDGLSLRVYDATDTDYIDIEHDGVDVNIAFNGTTEVNWLGGLAHKFFDSGGADFGSLQHNGTNFLIDNNAGETILVRNGTNVLRTQEHNATGLTTGGAVLDHEGNFRDIGINDLKVASFNAVATLGAQFSGRLWGKDNTTARTMTLEGSTTEDFPTYHCVHGINGGANDLTITEGSGVTLYYLEPGTGLVDTTGGCTVGPGGIVTIYRRNASTYWIWGSEISYT